MIEEYLAYLKGIRNYSAKTAEAYRNDLSKFAAFCSSEGIIEEELDYQEARGFAASLGREGLSPSSINRILSAVRGYFKYLIKMERIKANPFDQIKNKKQGRTLPDFLFEEEMEKLLSKRKEGFLGARDKLLLELLYSTGCRVSEAVGININEISLRDRTIMVRGKGSKERLVFLGKKAMEALGEYLPYRKERANKEEKDAQKALLLNAAGRRLSDRGVGYIIKGYEAEAGLGKNIHPHTFRHSFATHIMDRGADIRTVQELLGHSNLSTTQVYTHMSLSRLKKVYRSAHPHAGGGKK